MSGYAEWIDDALGALGDRNDPTAIEVIDACGRGCAARSGADEGLRNLGRMASGCRTRSEYAEFIRKNIPLEVEETDDGIVLHLGKSECTCPVSKGLERNAEMLCECTRAHERYTWSLFFDRPVDVEIVESLLRGGKDCVVKIIVPEKLRWTHWMRSP